MRPRVLWLLGCALTLSGCASLISAYQAQFECPRSTGDQPCEQASKAYLRAMTKAGVPHPPDPGRDAAPATSEEAYVPPVKTVWLAPYVDGNGRRHEPALLRMIVLPGPASLKPEPEFLVPPVPDVAEDGSMIGPPVPPADATPTAQGRSTPRTRTPQPGSPLRSSGAGSHTAPGLGHLPPGNTSGGFSIPGF
jgi:hypothetical protein